MVPHYLHLVIQLGAVLGGRGSELFEPAKTNIFP
jgi:hypothetical protein